MRNEFVIDLDISKSDFLKSKIDGRVYTDIGNFCKHLKNHKFTLESYTLYYYKNLIPKCIYSNEISNWKVKGYWNKWVSFKKEHASVRKKLLLIFNKIENIKREGFYSEFLDFDNKTGKVDIDNYINLMYFLFDQDNNFYKRLCNHYYDNIYKNDFIEKYKKSLLLMKPMKWPHGMSINSYMEMGNSIEESILLFNKWKSNFNSSFKRKDIQYNNYLKKLKKYSKEELRKFSVYCVEYWVSKGYSIDESIEKISNIQDKTSIESIMNRYTCSKDEAIDIQNAIYNKRKRTFEHKTEAELREIYKKQDCASMEYCLRKCDFNITKAKILYQDLLKKRTVPFGRASKESLKYFVRIYKELRHVGFKREDIFFGIDGNREYFIYDTNLNKIVFFDFVILSKKIIIEYDGVYWHSSEKDVMKDVYKTKLAEYNGFKLFRIRSDQPDILQKMKNFINENV